MFREFDRMIGLRHLVALHLNDSKTARGSRVDRHEHIGKGQIGLEAFRVIMRDRRFRKIPKVLETPKGKDLREDVENMRTLRRLASANAVRVGKRLSGFERIVGEPRRGLDRRHPRTPSGRTPPY